MSNLKSKVITTGGPRWLFDDVTERRRSGVPLHCILHMKSGSSSALAVKILDDKAVDEAQRRLHGLIKVGNVLNIEGHLFTVCAVAEPAEVPQRSSREAQDQLEVTFNRYWNSPDATAQPRKMIAKAPHLRPLYYSYRQTIRSIPSQFLIQLSVRMANGLRKQLLNMSALFEEDSNMGVKLLVHADEMRVIRDFLCGFSFMVNAIILCRLA